MNDIERARLRWDAAIALRQVAEGMPEGLEKASLLTVIAEIEAAALDLEIASAAATAGAPAGSAPDAASKQPPK